MEENVNSETKVKKDYLLPTSILIAALLVSGSLVFNAGKKAGTNTASLEENVQPQQEASVLDVVPPDKDDHIFGNPGAPVKVIEFSDLECPFCKSFHSTMKRIVADYGGRVAWIYRHFPLDSIHPKARKEAEASECAAALGGNQKFWDYIDRLFEITPSNNGLDPAKLPEIAEYVGLERGEFEECLSSGRHEGEVESDLEDAAEAGARGTPYSIVVTEDGKKYPISGALPYEQVKLAIDEALK